MKNSPLSGKNLIQLIVIAVFFASNFFSASAQQKVVGGIDVDIKDYPWQVAVDYGCGGSIIGDSWVLTAAHCVGGGVNYIYAGNSAPYASGGESYSVANVITHPSYGSGTSYSHDFALVEIEGEFNFSNPNIGKIDLISVADVIAGSEDAGVMATITGWGSLSSGGSMASTLQMVQAPIVSNEVACGSATDENGNSGDYGCSSLDVSMICAGDLIDGGEDACQGDSGGPLVVRSLIDNRWVLIGATSWGYGCADVNYPGVWSRVSYVLDWIEDNADVNSEYGCMDVAACNFSDEAIYNVPEACIYEIDECGDCGGSGPAPGYDCDGNCVTGETLIVSMSDSYGDGWNGSNLVVNGVSVTLSSGSSGSETLCFDSTAGCNEVAVSEGSWPSEVSWTISDGDGNVLLTGGAPYSGGFGAENCGPPVPGCTDPEALNYNSNASEEDGSCQYPVDCSGLTSVLVEVTDGSWPSEVSWELGDFTGGVGATSACLEDGCISFKMLDSYGDGWNGSIVTISSEGGAVLLTGTLESGSEGTLFFSLNYEGDCGPVTGCTDSNALNYNEEATQDDGSCDYVYGCTDETALNFNIDATQDDGSCTYPIAGCTDETALNYNSDAAVEDGSCYYDYDVLGCMDLNADNYNAEATYDDGSCEYPFACEDGYILDCDGSGECHPAQWVGDGYGDCEDQNWGADLTCYDNDGGDCGDVVPDGFGCTDSEALNFDPEAIEDDGSCQYPIDCDGLTSVTIDVGGGSWQEEVSWSIGGFSGGVGSTGACLEDGCLIFTMLDSYGDGWNGNFVTITSETGDVLLTGTLDSGSEGTLSFGLNFDGDCGPVYGCTDVNALNYNEEATADDGSCEYPIAGCTDPSALNFNPDAIEDDGSCEYPIDCEGLTSVIIEVTDGSYPSEVSWDISGFTGGVGSSNACLEDGCLAFNMTDSWGDGWNGSTVTISSEGGSVLLTGTLDAGYSGTLLFSLNYDGDCAPTYGCTDPSALNFNPDAIEDDGSCQYPVVGCTDPDAINFNPDAIEDDGSCQYPIDCSGLISITINMTDSYGDGWNGNNLIINGESFTIESGSESTANSCYDPEAGCVDVSCDGGSWQEEVSWSITDQDGNLLLSGGAPYVGGFGGEDCSPAISGCTDPNALNYNPEAVEDDGSCDYDIIIDYGGCTDPAALNYDPNATFDDGSCEYDASCTDVIVSLTLNTGSYGNEVYWSVIDADGVVIALGDGYDSNSSYQSQLCIEDNNSYTFIASDSYGDGWNGAEFYIESSECELVSGGLESGYSAEYEFTSLCSDIDPCATVDCADGFECINGDCVLIDGGSPWDVYITGTNHTIVIDGSAVIDLEETTIEVGDVLGVFYTDSNGELQCAGQTTWTGTNSAIAAQGDDSTTDEVDGFVSGSEFVWMVWDASEGIELMVLATYNQGLSDQGNFVVNGYSALSGLTLMPTGPSEQTLSLPLGWSNFSVYMLADNMDLAFCLNPIIDNVIIAKDNAGLAYLPEWNFNGVGDVLIGQGYQIKLTDESTLVMEGTYMQPEENPISLLSGWNMIGYLRLEPSPADAVLADITATGNLVIAKDYNGNAYLPEWNFNGIGDMVAGQAYQLKVNEADVLQYLPNDQEYRLGSLAVTENNVTHYAKVSATDKNMTVVIEDAAWDVLPTEGSEIAAFDKDGNMVGSAIYSSPVTVLTVWGDDATTSSKDGLLVSESVSFKVWNTNEVRDFRVSKWIEGSSSYQVDGISVASTIETNNVMTELNASERVLVKVINVLGQEVNLDDEPFKGTVLFNVYDDGSVEQFVR